MLTTSGDFIQRPMTKWDIGHKKEINYKNGIYKFI